MKIAVLAAIFVGLASAILPAGAQVDAQVQPSASVPSASTVDSAQVSQMLQQYEAVHSDLENARENFGEDNPHVRPLRDLERRLVDEMSELRKDRDRAADRYRASELEIQNFNSVFRERTGRVDVSPDGLRSAMRALDEQRQALVIEQAGERARREATQEIVAKESERAHDAALNDPVIQELAQIVDVRNKELDQINAAAKTGSAPAASVLDAQSALAEAKIKLAEHGKDLAAKFTGFNEKIEEMTVDEAEKQATLQAVNDQLGKLNAVSEQIDRLEQLQNGMKDAEADLRQAEIDARLVERELAISPPHSDATQPAATQPNGQH